jgi:hypothetical protein
VAGDAVADVTRQDPSAAVAQKPSLAKASKMVKQSAKGRALEREGLER